jgi:hypothetical protein
MHKESFLNSPLVALLEHIVQEIHADFAYLYRAADPAGAVELVARTGVTAPHAYGAILDGNRLIVAASAWSDPRLLSFPDIVLDRIESAAIIPVDALPGRAVLAVGRRQPLPFEPRHIALFEMISMGFSAVLFSLRQAEQLSELPAA